MDDQHQATLYKSKHKKQPSYSIKVPLYSSAMYKQEIHSTPSIYIILAKQKTIETFHECLHSYIEGLGFSLFQISYLDREKFNKKTATDWPKHTWQALANSAPTLSRHPPKDEGCFRISSVKSAVTQIDADTLETYTGELIDIFGSMDFHDSYSLSTPAFMGEGFLILTVMAKGLSKSEFKDCIAKNSPALAVLIDAINAIGGLKFPNFIFDKRSTDHHLPPKKSMQALHWASQGLAHKQIAQKMNISTKTVNDHLRAARENLNARSTGHAIRLAFEQGLLN